MSLSMLRAFTVHHGLVCGKSNPSWALSQPLVVC